MPSNSRLQMEYPSGITFTYHYCTEQIGVTSRAAGSRRISPGGEHHDLKAGNISTTGPVKSIAFCHPRRRSHSGALLWRLGDEAPSESPENWGGLIGWGWGGGAFHDPGLEPGA